MHTTNLSASLLPLMKQAKLRWILGDDPGEIVDNLLKACQTQGIQIVAPPAWRPLTSYISGGLHRATFQGQQQQIIIVGPTGAGKDLLTMQCLDLSVAAALGDVILPNGETVKILEDEDSADKTRAIIRCVFGKGDLILFNTPGLYSDDPELEAMTRSVLGLETEMELPDIGYIDSARSPAAEYERRRVEDIPINRDQIIVVYMVNLKLTPFRPISQHIHKDLQEIHEWAGEKLFVVGSFLDGFKKWDPDDQERRRNDWSAVLQKDIQMVEYSGRTGEGLPSVIHQLLRASNQDPSSLLPFLREERKSSRLTFSIFTLGAILSSLCGDLDQHYPYRDLLTIITLTCALHLTAHYSVSEQDWFAKNGDISQIAENGILTDTVSQERDPKGLWEWISRLWSRKRLYEDTQIYHISIKALGEVLGLLYALIHELEGVSSAVVADANGWFADELEKVGVASALSDKDTEAVQRALSDVMLKFWRLHHPEALDLKARLNL